MDRVIEIRRLKYLASRRSTLELDLLLRGIVGRLDWDRLDDGELAGLAWILDLDDVALQKALMTRGPAPDGADPDLWQKLLALVPRTRDDR